MSDPVPAFHRRASRPIVAAGLIWAGFTATAAAGTTDCPAVLAGARTLVLVTTQGMNASRARLRRFGRQASGAPWRSVGPAEPAEPAVVGARGLAWGDPFRVLAREGEPVKTEGDRRTPAGIYRFGRSFGVAASPRPGYLVLRPGEAICVDDPASSDYNTIVSGQSITPGLKGEDMGAEPLYRRGLVIEYPSDAGRRAGSCIFLHVWRGPASGTAGCVALPEARVAALQDVSRDATAIAILPNGALDRFAGCLPGIVAAR